MCAGDCQFFPSALPSYLVQSHKKQPIYMDVTYSLHISFIYSYISPFISFRVTKNSLYLYICTSHTLSKYFSHFLSHINILIFTPFSFRGTKKQPILTSHIFSLCFSHFLSYINFPSLLIQL